ncbi:MAG: DNA mismatch repair endonuclease MutL [Spirochaetes bacterium]|nr:MAG: DNA mismatch repair endonuclease MutL [Spirochaetota bacterium]
MNRIELLPDHVKRTIAAGEVVEGPFSVVKELLENALDAHAGEIEVEIAEAGLKKIAVRDNGEGIVRDDIPLSVMEHATSKIRTAGDIETIQTFGFRGEALSSISAISRLTILSRTGDAPLGGRLLCREGSIDMGDYAGPRGTMVIVENLFYNTPARKKFLKGRAAEIKNIKSVFLKIALAHPSVRFTLVSDGKRELALEVSGSVGERIEQIYGKGVTGSLYHERLSDIRASIHGFLSAPDFLKSSRSMQVLFVNDRLVEYRYMGFLLSRGYEAIAPRGRHPAAILFLDVDPGLIDVNIHPAKREIKFFDQRYIDSLIQGLCRKALDRTAHRLTGRAFRQAAGPDAQIPRPPSSYDAEDAHGTGERAAGQESFQVYPSPAGADALLVPPIDPLHVAPGLFVREGNPGVHDAAARDGFRVLGVAFASYIVFESEGALHVMDFHAAHERIIYDRIMSRTEEEVTQELIFPHVLALSIEEYDSVIEHRERLGEIGFDIDPFPDHSVVVRGVPAALGRADMDTFFRDLVEALKNGTEADIEGRAAETVACHAARRAGDALSMDEAERLTSEALSGRHDLRCPHGRPFLYKMGKKDIERMFRRS